MNSEWQQDPRSGLWCQIRPINGYYYIVYQNNTQVPCRDQQGNYMPVAPTIPRHGVWQQPAAESRPAPRHGQSYTHISPGRTNQVQTPQQPNAQNPAQWNLYPGTRQSSADQQYPNAAGAIAAQPSPANAPSQSTPAGPDNSSLSRTLDETYRIRRHPERFFVPGRVMSVLWSEPAGPGANSYSSEITINYLGGRVHSKIRRFVVVRASERSCLALSIHTYGGQGVAKPGVKKSDHGIIHTGPTPPAIEAREQPRSLNESPMRPLSIRVIPTDMAEALDRMSRVDYSKVYTVEYNWPVKDFGLVHGPDLVGALNEQWRAVRDAGSPT